MAGKGIPHRYTVKRSNTLRERNVDEVALYFKELQTYAAAQPYLNPTLSVKALSPSAKASSPSRPNSSQKRTQAADEGGRKLKVNFNPNAKRKPGQVLKLHTSYDEMLSKDGGTFGWVDPRKELSENELKDAYKKYADAVSKRPTVVLRQYEIDEQGRVGPRVIDEVRFKQLGQTIGQMQPGRTVGNAAAAALGVVFDANGKMRCPPGTPNANQFTDENMSNCFSFTPVTVARGILRGMRRLAERMGGSGGAISDIDRRFDTEYDAEAFQRVNQAKRVYTTPERMREKWNARMDSISGVMSRLGIESDASVEAGNGDMVHALAEQLGGISKIEEIYGDVPGFRLVTPDGEILTDDIWNAMSVAEKKDTIALNGQRYDAEIRTQIAQYLPQSVKDAVAAGDPAAIDSANSFVDKIRTKHHDAQRGMLGSLVQYKDEMEQSGVSDSFDKIVTWMPIGPDGEVRLYSEAQAIPDMDENGFPKAVIELSPMNIALQAEGAELLGKKGVYLDIESDTTLSETQKQQEILRAMREITEAQEFVDLVNYANEQTAARGVADLGVSAAEMKGSHVMWHELAHVQQYNVVRNKIMDFYDKNGFFPVVVNGQLVKIDTPPSAWTNGVWLDAMNSVMGAGGRGMYSNISDAGFPPFGADVLEESMLHLVSGQRYQDQVGQALDVLGLPEEGRERSLALMEGTAELFALEKMGVIEGPEVRQFTSWMDPVESRGIGGNIPPGEPPQAPDVPGPDVPEIPAAPPVEPSPAPGTTIINNNTVINVVINGPINIHVGGTAPDWDKESVDPPTPQRATVDLKWEDVTPMILGDRDSQWTAKPSSGASIGQNKDLQKLWIDSAFGLGPNEGGYIPEQGELPRIDKDAYWKLSPSQMDARYERIRGEVDLLLTKSETEPLTKDEQAKLWLGIKALQQILDVNAKKAALSDEKRDEYLRDGFDPTPGRYIRQVDSPLKPQQKGFRALAKKRADERGYDSVEVDDDELSHWSREIAAHAGTSTDRGADGFDASKTPYKRGEVRNNPNFSTKKNLERNPNYKPSDEAPTPDSDSVGYTGSKLDEIKSRATPEQQAILDSSEPIESRSSLDALVGPSDPESVKGMLSKSAAKRQEAKEGADILRPTPGSSGDVLDEEFDSGIVPVVDLMDSSTLDDDVRLVTSMSIPKNGIGDGDTIDHQKIIRGKVADFDTVENLEYLQPTSSRRVVIDVPKGSRGLPSKNSHNGETDDFLIPPGSLSVVRVDPDGTIYATPLKQDSKADVLNKMEANLNAVELEDGSLEELERRAVLSSIAREKSKITPEPRKTRGMSSSGPVRARQTARNQAIVDAFDRNDSSIYAPLDGRIGEERIPALALIRPLDGETIDRNIEIPKRNQRVQASVAKLGGLISGTAEPANDDEFEFVSSLSPEVRSLFESLNPEEIQQLVDDELFDFHQNFDDRVRIALHPEEFKEFLKTGKLKNIVEAKPNSAAAGIQKDFETRIGMGPLLPGEARSHSGYMVHSSFKAEIADWLNELPGAGVTRNPHFFSETDEINPSGYKRVGGKTIDLVLAPEVAQRAVYGRGDITNGEVLPTPVLSTNRSEVGSAFINISPDSSSTDLDGMKQIAEVLEASVTGNKAGLGGGYGLSSSSKSRNPGVAHEALVAGGITIADAEQVRIPPDALDMEGVSVSFDDVDLTDVRQKLGEAGLSDKDIDAVLENVGNGIAPYVVPEIERMRQAQAARKMNEELAKVPNHSMTLVPTNPDGIDVLNPDPIPGEPVNNREAWMKRYAMDSSIDGLVKLAIKEKREKGNIQRKSSASSAADRGESRVAQRARGVKYSADGFESLYERETGIGVDEIIDSVEYNPKTRELRVRFAGEPEPYNFLDVDPDDIEDLDGPTESIGSKLDRIKNTRNREVRGPGGDVVFWNGKEWRYKDEGLSSKKPNIPFDKDTAGKTPDDISFETELNEILTPSTRNMDRIGRPDALLVSGMSSRRDSKLAAETKPQKFSLGKTSKIKEGVESDEERRKRILELSKGDPRSLPSVRKANYSTYDGKDVYTVDNIDDALALLLAGHHVDLSDTHDETDLWKEFKSFKKWLKGVDKAAAKKMSFNLCAMHKEGANILCGKHKGIIRDDMPQVGGTVTDPNAPAIRLWVGGHIHGNSFDSYNGADAPDWVKQGLKSDPNSPEFAKAKEAYDALENRYRALGSRYYPGNTVDPLSEEEKQEFFSLTDIRKVEPDMIDNFVDVLRANGINVSDPEERDPLTLRATQNELVAGTVLGLSDAITSYEDMLRLGQRPDGTPFTQQDYDRVRMLGPILITKDGYILDGHHRVFGKVAANFDRDDNDQLSQRVRVVDMPLEALLAFTRAYQEHIGIASASGQSTERRTLPDDIQTPLDIIPMSTDDLTSLNGDFTENLETKINELDERDGHPFFKPESPGFEEGRSYRESMRFVERRRVTTREPGQRSSPSRVSSRGMTSQRNAPEVRSEVGTNRAGMRSSVVPNDKKVHERAVSKAMDDIAGVNLNEISDSELESRFGATRRGEKSLINGEPIYHTKDAATAVALLSQGYNVEVDDDGTSAEVANSQAAFRKLIEDKVEEIAKLEGLSSDEKKALIDRFAVDLCKLYVAGKNMMCEENIGIDREDMPQLSGRALGDDTLAVRAAKSGLVPVKEWVPANKKNLTPEQKQRFKELAAKHASPGKDETFAPGEKEEFYSMVDWNDSEIDIIGEFEKSLKTSLTTFDEDGNPAEPIKVKTGKPDMYKASQRQLDASKVDGMRKGIKAGLDKFDEHAESLGLKKSSPEYFELRNKWLQGDYKFVDANGDGVKAWWNEPLLATRDGYVLDGHHRWAAIRLLNDGLPEDEKLDITWKEVQTNVVEALTLGKAFQDKWGIKEARITGERKFVKNDAVPGISASDIDAEMDSYQRDLPDTIAKLHSNNQFIRRGSVGAKKNPEVAAATVDARKRGGAWAASQRGVQGGRVRVSREQLEEIRSGRQGMSSSSARNVRVRAGEGGVPVKVSSGQPDTPAITAPPKVERTHKGVEIPEFVDEMPKPGQYDDDIVEKAIELHEKVKKVEPELTDSLIDMAQEHGGEMEGLEYRFKATKGNAKKINNIARDKGISVEEAQSQVGDAVRYTMTFDEENYVDGVNNALEKLAEMGHEAQVKNYWDEGDGYQGINVVVKHPDGFLYELQFHTPESFKVKQAAHDAYDEYQAERDDAIRLTLFRRMAAAASQLPMPKGRVKDIGTLSRKNFQTWSESQGGPR